MHVCVCVGGVDFPLGFGETLFGGYSVLSSQKALPQQHPDPLASSIAITQSAAEIMECSDSVKSTRPLLVINQKDPFRHWTSVTL